MQKMKKALSLFLAIVLLITTVGIVNINAATTDTRYSDKRLQNGGFETLTETTVNKIGDIGYCQPLKTEIEYWDTTAFGQNNNGTQGKFEFFGSKSNGVAPPHFSQSNSNKDVAEGNYAAELNADENSTIYQRIKTVSGSTYTWGLDHRGRDTTDTMVLFIGPEQYKTVDGVQTAIDPSKPSRVNKDQFVRMTDWLKTQYGVTYPATGCSQKYTIYSKPFDYKGKFQNESEDENKNISMVETDECTQEWNLWVISSLNNNKSENEFEAVKGWSKYGTNCYNKNDDSYNDVINGEDSRLGYDCTYTVPKGQTRTLFAFTSFSGARKNGNTYTDDITYGNLLDDVNFKLYQPISSSITNGGSGGVEGGKVTVSGDIESGKLFADVTEDGNVCKIYTAKSSNDDRYKFVGAYIIETLDDGTESTRYVNICHHNLTGLTKEQIEAEHANVGFVPYNHDGNVTDDAKWDYYFVLQVNNPVHIHMIYTKAPYVIYDSNGGLPYKFGPKNETGDDSVAFGDGYYKGSAETESYYKNSYYKLNEEDHEQEPHKEMGYYYSHKAYDNPNWKKNSFGVGAKFVGWSVLGKDNNMHTFDANHKIEYMPIDAAGGSIKIFNVDEEELPEEERNIVDLALDENDGVTLTAQWQFGYTAQAQTLTDSLAKTYENTALGGWVEETFINDSSNVDEYTEDVNGETRVKRTDAYGSVGEKIIFRATPDAANNYVFDGWYKIKDGEYTLITTTPNLAITVEQGNSTTYYARFKTKTVPVIFHYSESGSSDGYDYYDKNDANKYGKYFQDVVYNEKAVKPTGDSKSVTMWFTSPTERDQDHLFSFNTPITEETHLYASPSFTFNYTNYFRIKEPWELETYCTLRFDGNYLDMKTDADISDYTIYLLKGASADEAGGDLPTAETVRKNAKQIKKNSSGVVFDTTTKSGKTFNRAGAKYDHSFIFEMKKPVWVMFDFTYKGIRYTTPVKNRSLYENIDRYKESDAETWYSTLPADTQSEMRNAQILLVDSIKAMYDKVSTTGITDPTSYFESTAVSGLTYDSTIENPYTFTSTTAIRNIEPWGLKYTFSVNDNEMSSFADYGAVVFTDKEGTYSESGMTVADLIGNEGSVMFSKSSGNIYVADDGNIEAYYVNNMLATDFSKKTYVVFFVKDSNGNYYYSSVVNNCYNDLATTENTEVSKSIVDYSNALTNYFNLRDSASQSVN